VLACDVSDSVRAVASFLLEFTHAVQELGWRAQVALDDGLDRTWGWMREKD